MRAPGKRKCHLIVVSVPEDVKVKLDQVPKGKRSAFIAWLIKQAKRVDYEAFISS